MSDALRIAFIGQKGLPARWGGVEAHVEAIATRLAERGHDVTAYVRRWYSGGRVETRAVRHSTVPTLHTKHLDAAIHSGLASLDTVRRSFDIVHFHAIGPSLFCWLPKLAGAKVVATIHGLDYRQAKWGRLAKVSLRLGERMALAVPDRTLVVSKALQSHYAQLGFETTYLANGIDAPERFGPERIRRRYGLVGGDYVLFLGRWTPNKRLVELVRAYRRMVKPSFKLVVAGDDTELGAYGRRLRLEARGEPNVIMPGLVDGRSKAELLSNARAIVSPSDHEGLPIALLEAMSYGKPCLVSDIPAHREVLGDVGAGIVCDMSTLAGIVLALSHLDDQSRTDLEEMGRRGRRRVQTAYNWDLTVDALEALYRSLIVKDNRTRRSRARDGAP